MEYVANLSFRLSGDLTKLDCPVDSLQYFPDDILTLLSNEVFIDCGAYDGDTLKNYLRIQNEFEAYIAHEPDPINFEQLLKFTEGLDSKLKSKIKCRQNAVSDMHKWVSFEAKGTAGSSIGVGDLEIACCSLDNEIGTLKPTYIKMDIEGSEVAALEGAEQCIRNNLPTLGICVYHRPDDLWQIPLLIHSFSKEYEFYLRSHEAEGWDLVCYAIPRSRDANASDKQ
jgi:FkbM family methyltransferase